MLIINVTFILSSLFLLIHGFQEENFLDGQLTLVVEDNLEQDGSLSNTFSPRSSISIRSVKSGNTVVRHTRFWSDTHTISLQKLAENDGFYEIRIRSKEADESQYVSTFTKACLMYESNLSEIISLTLDNNGMSVVGVGLYTPIQVCQGLDKAPSFVSFNTTVITKVPIVAPLPDTASFIQKMEAVKNEKAEGKDNRSFLAKYWMYIIPVVLILMISGGGPDAAGMERISENIHISANEPSLALYRLQEHVRRALPPTVTRRQNVLQLNAALQGSCYDVEYALGAVESMTGAEQTINSIQELLKDAIFYKRQIKYEQARKRKESSMYKRFSSHLSSIDIPDLPEALRERVFSVSSRQAESTHERVRPSQVHNTKLTTATKSVDREEEHQESVE